MDTAIAVVHLRQDLVLQLALVLGDRKLGLNHGVTLVTSVELRHAHVQIGKCY